MNVDLEEIISFLARRGEVELLQVIKHIQEEYERSILISGLINNELCIWIYSQNINHEEAIEILKNSVDNVELYIESGQLTILPYTKWYVLDNSFNELRLNRQNLQGDERCLSCMDVTPGTDYPHGAL